MKTWTCNNKLLIFFILLALCLFVSTVALATREECNLLLAAQRSKDATEVPTEVVEVSYKKVRYDII